MPKSKHQRDVSRSQLKEESRNQQIDALLHLEIFLFHPDCFQILSKKNAILQILQISISVFVNIYSLGQLSSLHFTPVFLNYNK